LIADRIFLVVGGVPPIGELEKIAQSLAIASTHYR
jgi:hypothetical protein